MSEEIWKPMAGFEDKYEISSLGNIRTIPRIIPTHNNGYVEIKQEMKKFNKHYKGCFLVNVKIKGKTKKLYVHRLVAQTFIPNPNGYKYVNHKDENKENNSVDNLEWCTAKYNNTYGTRLDRIKNTRKKNKIPPWNSIKIIIGDVEYPSITEASRSLGISIYKLNKMRK